MRFRFSPLVTGVLVVAAVVLMSGLSLAHFYELGPSKDEWGLKYTGEVTAVEGNKLNVSFTLSDAGRLNPFYSISVVAFSDLRPDGGRTYLVKTQFDLKQTADGKLTGQVQIPKEHANRAKVRILTQIFDGKPQPAGARYYDIPLKKLMKNTPESGSQPAPPSVALPPSPKVTR